MKPIAKKLSSVVLSLAMVASLTPFPGGLLLADETETETPTTVEETEAEKKKEPEKPAETKAKETKPEAEAPKETEKPAETEAPKETESAETEAPKETEKPAETPDETVPETEAPAETEKPEADQPKETEAPAETEKPAEEVPEETKEPAETPDETKAPDNTDEKAPGEDKNKAKDTPIDVKDIDNVILSDGVLTWDAVEGATQYDIEFEDHTFTVNNNSFKLGETIDRLIKQNEITKSDDNDYYIYITAYDNSGMYRGQYSNYFYYTTEVENTQGKLSTSIKKGVLSWKAYPNATEYSVLVANYYSSSTTGLSVNLNSMIDRLIEDEDISKAADGKYAVFVSAVNKYGVVIAKYEFTHTYTSNAAPIVEGTITGAKITDGILTWDPFKGADYYNIDLSTAWGKTLDKTSYKIGEVIDEMISSGECAKTGKYWIGITAYDKYERVIASFSGDLAYESTAEETKPGKISGAGVDTNGILKWDAYEGASKYWVEIDGGNWGEYVESNTNSLDLHKAIDKLIRNDEWFKSDDGDYLITIYADNSKGITIAQCQLTHHYESTVEPVIWEEITGITFDSEGFMTWDEVKNAVKYKVYVSDVEFEVTTPYFEINSNIDKLVAAGTIEKDTSYYLYIDAYNSEGIHFAGWDGSYYYKTSSKAPSMGKIANVKSTNGILSWSKFNGATKYKVNVMYDDVVVCTTSSNSVYLNDMLTQMINAEKIGNNGSFDIEILALNKAGNVIAKGYYYYDYLEPNSLTVASKTAKKAPKAKRRKKTTISASKLYQFIDKGQGKLTFSKVSGKKQFSVNKTSGKITVKKGLKKKTYTVKVKIAASGRTVFAATTRTVTLKIKVK